MKTAKRLLTVVLAGIMALAFLTGCGSDTAFGKDIYDAYVKGMDPKDAEMYSYSEKLNGRATAVLKAIDREVQKDSGVTWDNAIHITDGMLMSQNRFGGEGEPFKTALFNGKEPDKYYVEIALTEVLVDDPEFIQCVLMDQRNNNMGWVSKSAHAIPRTAKMKMGAAKYKASNGKIYAVCIGLVTG